jgi:hypothetical protein
MAHLSPLKGGFPHKDQHDRSALVTTDEASKAIERGTIICVNEDGRFQIAADTSIQPLYIALQDYDDLQAVFAGTFSIGKGEAVDGATGTHTLAQHPDVSLNAPKITGIHMDDGDVWETDMFDEKAEYKIGAPLTVKDGLVTAAGENDDVVGYVYKEPYTRYANDAVVLAGMMTGGMIRVIAYQCGK